MTSTEQTTTPVWASAEPPAVNGTPVPHMTAPVSESPVIEGPPKSSRFRTALVGTVAALVIGGGGFAVIRASGDSSAPASQQTGVQGAQGAQGAPGGAGGGQGAPGGMGGGGGGMGRGASGLSGVMYGDFVASDSNGGYVTRRLQTGTVTAVSATSITAKSADGHATTFAVTSSTTVSNGGAGGGAGGGAIGDVQVGATVTVVGTVSGDTATATTITAASTAN